MQSHENLKVWQRSVELSVALYATTKSFPATETYGLSAQMRRAVVSIPSNIAEGRRRGTDADFCHFLRMAHGSLAELETQLLIAHRLDYIAKAEYEKLIATSVEVGKMLGAMITRLSAGSRLPATSY